MVTQAATDEGAIDVGRVMAAAELARIALAADEAERLARDLGRILAAAETLARLDLEGIDASYRPSTEGPDQPWWPDALRQGATGGRPAVGVEPGDGAARLRADAPVAGLDRSQALQNAPVRDETFFVVPTVVERT